MGDLEKLIAELTGQDDERAEAAVPGIAGHGVLAVPRLRELLDSPDVDARWWATRALAEIEQPNQVPQLLIYALGDQDPGVRQCAALGLRKQPDPQAILPLAKALIDPDHLVAALAADALAANGAPAVPALLEVLHDGPQPARLEAVRALANIGDHRSIPALFEVLDDDSQLAEYWASEGLERMGVGMAFFKP